MIIVQDLWKKFGQQAVLKGVNLQIEEGETVVILGRSGSGKSVLLRHIIGLEQPDQGCVQINGKEVESLTEEHFYTARADIGMLFQGGALFDSLSVRDNTAFYLSHHLDPDTGLPFSSEFIAQRTEEVLHMVGLSGSEHKMPSDLSGGMRKRAAFARLLAYRPQILLYDEPSTGLDPIMSLQIAELIVQTQTELQATSIVVTHDIPMALKVADRLALHDAGQIVCIEKKADFIKNRHPLIQSFLKNATPDLLIGDARKGDVTT